MTKHAQSFCLLFLCAALLLATGCVSASNATTPSEKEETTEDATIVSNYETCIAAGGRVLRTLPPKCVDANGFIFVAPVADRGCVDLCGDGTCDELVCQAIGCPCAETAENCPADCVKQ